MLRMEQNNNEIVSIAGNQATILDLLNDNDGQMESNAEVVPSTSASTSTDDTQEVEVKVESNDER